MTSAPLEEGAPAGGAGAVPQQRIVEKLNEYMSRRHYAGAERHLLYWREEAKLLGDARGLLMILGEMVGHYRKTGEKEKAFACGEEALQLLKRMDFEESLSAATTYINIATMWNSFGENGKALALFARAKEIYEASPNTQPGLLGGLYNNMAQVCVSEGRFAEALPLYEQALAVMEKVPGGELEQAITYLNMADAVEAEQGMEEGEGRIFRLLDLAEECLGKTEAPRNGYYAFVCEKCAPAFEYYGYFQEAERLRTEAERIYAGTGTEP